MRPQAPAQCPVLLGRKVTKGNKRCVFQDLNPAPFGKLKQNQTRYPLGHDRYGRSPGPAKFHPLYTLTPTLKRAYSDASAVTSVAYREFRSPRNLTRVTPNLQYRFIRDLRGSAKSWQRLPKVGRTGDRSLDLELL
jgi:hypothetical protein